MNSMKFFRKAIFAGLVFSSLGAFAQDAMMKFMDKRPDVIYQMNFSDGSNNFLMMRAKDVIEDIKGYDLFDRTLELPKYQPLVHKNGLGDYLVGEMGKTLEKILLETMGLNFKGAKTTFDVYGLKYKLVQPRLRLDIVENADKTLDVIAKIQVRKFTVSADKIYVNNNSPGISVKRYYEDANLERTQVVYDQETMTDAMRAKNPQQRDIMDFTTIIDDLYLKIQSPEDRPLVIVDGGLAGKDQAKEVISGELRIGLERISSGALQLKYKNFDVSLYGAKDGEQLSKYIDFQLGQDTKIGSFQGIEYGNASLDMGNKSFLKIVNSKKELLTKLVSQPIIDQIFSPEIKAKVKEQVNRLIFNPIISKDLKDFNVNISSSVNELGILNPDRENKDNVNQLRIGIDLDVNRPEYPNFKYEPSYTPVSERDYEESERIIAEKINNKEQTLIISIDQEFLNKAISLNVKGREKMVLSDVPDYVTLGKKGVFLQFDDQNQGKLVIDLFARDKFFMRMASAVVTGRSKYFFPVVVTPEIKLEMKNDIPTLVVRVKDIDITDETLMNGAYGVPSNLDKGWSKKLVMKYCRDEMKPSIGSTVYELPLTDFKGMDLSKLASIQSDGNGRLNIQVNLLAYQEQRHELAKLPAILSNMLKQKQQ